MRCFCLISRWAFSSPASAPLTLPQLKLTTNLDWREEDRLPACKSSNYYPAKPGDIIGNRFQLLVKLGYGILSTIWMARNLQDGYVKLKPIFEHEFRDRRIIVIRERKSELVGALKIANCDGAEENEVKIEEHIAKTGLSHRAYSLLRTCQERFEEDGLHSKHICSVYPALRESMLSFQRRFVDEVIPYLLIKVYLMVLLEALEYLHKDCNVVHTGMTELSHTNCVFLQLIANFPQT